MQMLIITEFKVGTGIQFIGNLRVGNRKLILLYTTLCRCTDTRLDQPALRVLTDSLYKQSSSL